MSEVFLGKKKLSKAEGIKVLASDPANIRAAVVALENASKASGFDDLMTEAPEYVKLAAFAFGKAINFWALGKTEAEFMGVPSGDDLDAVAREKDSANATGN